MNPSFIQQFFGLVMTTMILNNHSKLTTVAANNIMGSLLRGGHWEEMRSLEQNTTNTTTTTPANATNATTIFIDPDQHDALLDFFDEIGKDYWYRKPSSTMLDNPCDDAWPDVVCNNNGEVEKILLMFNNCNGSITEKIDKLTALNELVCYGNPNLHGPLTSSMCTKTGMVKIHADTVLCDETKDVLGKECCTDRY